MGVHLDFIRPYWADIISLLSTSQRFNGGHYYATDLCKQGRHLSVLQKCTSLWAVLFLLFFFYPRLPFASFSSLCAKSQHPLFRPEKRRLLRCSTCVPSSGNAEQLEEMWSSSACQRTSHSLSLKAHPGEANNGTMFSFTAVKTEGPVSCFFLRFWLSCMLSAAKVTERESHLSCLDSHTAGQQKLFALALCTRTCVRKQWFEVIGNGFNDLTSKWVHYRIHLHLEYIHALHQKWHFSTSSILPFFFSHTNYFLFRHCVSKIDIEDQ